MKEKDELKFKKKAFLFESIMIIFVLLIVLNFNPDCKESKEKKEIEKIEETEDNTTINTWYIEKQHIETSKKCATRVMKEKFFTNSTCKLSSIIGDDSGWAYDCRYKTSVINVTISINAEGYLVYYVFYDGNSLTSGICD